ncbi:NosD domain-containing protein [Chloroflexota bacterium]
MIRKMVRSSIAIVFALLLFAGSAWVGTALAEDAPLQLPWEVEGVGVLFEVTGSEYLNVTLESTELVYAYLSSVPSVIELRLEAADGALATGLTLSGLAPGGEYHLYTDDLHNHAVLSADETGLLSWTQDLVDPHLIFIQTVPSTIFIDEDGGDCVSGVGLWDGVSTCTLTVDLSEAIQINGSGITLDGNGKSITSPDGSAAGVFIISGTGVTVKDLTIDGFANGIYLYEAADCFIRGNTIKNITGSGIKLSPLNQNSVGGGNLVTGNQILDSQNGIWSWKFQNTFIRNTIHAQGAAAYSNGEIGSFYNNNLVSYQTPFYSPDNTPPTLSTALPYGGNYWLSYDSFTDGCVDIESPVGICDDPYVPTPTTHIDEYPWTKPDGWLDIVIDAPVDPIMFDEAGVNIEVSAHFKDVDVDTFHTAIEWDWGDGNTSPAVVAAGETGGEGDVVTAQHTYDETGVYEIKLTMQDDPYLSTVVKSYKYVVVYDPSAGFVTGGGYIDSPAGAYVPDSEMTGQATFGFIAKFFRTRTGENDLSGTTVFEFHTAGLQFTSTSYDFLVVREVNDVGKATYRGVGDCVAPLLTEDPFVCSFMLTAQDDENGGDLFRIQIWNGDQVTGLIYDNKIGEPSNDEDAGTVITDGSIIIQTASKTR